MTEPRTITLATADAGDVTIPCPAWCVGHAHHDPLTERVDLTHAGPDVDCTHRGHTLFSAALVQSPFSTSTTPELGGPIPGVSVYPLGRTLDPIALYDLAGALDGYADRLRSLADQLTAILTEDQR